MFARQRRMQVQREPRKSHVKLNVDVLKIIWEFATHQTFRQQMTIFLLDQQGTSAAYAPGGSCNRTSLKIKAPEYCRFHRNKSSQGCLFVIRTRYRSKASFFAGEPFVSASVNIARRVAGYPRLLMDRWDVLDPYNEELFQRFITLVEEADELATYPRNIARFLIRQNRTDMSLIRWRRLTACFT